MSERIAYLNGEFVVESQAKVSILDRGFLFGDSVYDASRTFNGVPWRMREHIERLYQSCRYARLDPGISIDEMDELSKTLVEKNADVYSNDEEFRIHHWVTRGGGITIDTALLRDPHTVVIFTLPMDYERFAHGFLEGVPSVVTGIRRTPPECLEPRAKVGNKMNHLQAEFEAKQAGAWAIMLDTRGFVAEGPAYNCFIVRDGELLTPRLINCLGGINRSYVLELAAECGIPARETDLTHYDLLTADEAFHTSNTLCLLPVRSIDGSAMQHGAPGPITNQLTECWIEAVGCDWREKAIRTLNRV